MGEQIVNIPGCRALIAAILDQAFVDAKSKLRCQEWESAVRFIDEKNLLFCHYCTLLGFDPVWVANRMQKRLRTEGFKPISIFRD